MGAALALLAEPLAAMAVVPEWSEPTQISLDGETQGQAVPDVASGSDGRTVAVWSTTSNVGAAPYGVRFAIRGANGAWTAAQTLDADTFNTTSFSPGVVAAPGGIYHVAWVDADGAVLHASLGQGATAWSAVTSVTDAAHWGRFVAVDVDDAGALHVLWRDDDAGTVRPRYRRRAADGTWGAVELVADEVVNLPNSQYQLVVDGDGNAVASWTGPANEVRASRRVATRAPEPGTRR